MLQTHTVQPELLELLNLIMEDKNFYNFNLVDGTALALQLGHRQSVDIDLFGEQVLDEMSISYFMKTLGDSNLISKSTNILIYIVNGIKVDIVNYNYKLLKEPVIEDNIRMASKPDIAAMKLNAIAGRGTKKDFIDLFFLLKEFSLTECIEFYATKYQNNSLFMVEKSLTYFEDAEKEVMPKMYIDIDWAHIKSFITHEISKYSKT